MSELVERNRRRDDLADSIDRLYLQAESREAKETMSVFKQICEDIRQISDILTKVAETNYTESTKVAKMLERLEQRMTDHENRFREKVEKDNVKNAAISTRDSMIKWIIGGIATVAFAMSGTAIYKIFDVASLFNHVTQIDKDLLRVQETASDHSKRLYDLEIKFVENLRIGSVEKELVTVKKKHLEITSKKAFNAMR